MKEKTYKAILNAIELLANQKPAKTNGKITGLNLAKEAGVSKATLYRCFEEDSTLSDAYDTLRNNGVQETDIVPENTEQANRLLKDEVTRLHAELSASKRQAAQDDKLKAHQIELLWLEINRLQKEVESLKSQSSLNVVRFSPDKT